MEFKQFDMVTWTSQSHAYRKEKTGRIICVLEPGKTPSNPNHGQGVSFRVPYHGSARKHESYIVEANGKLYWPLVKYLRKAQ